MGKAIQLVDFTFQSNLKTRAMFVKKILICILLILEVINFGESVSLDKLGENNFNKNDSLKREQLVTSSVLRINNPKTPAAAVASNSRSILELMTVGLSLIFGSLFSMIICHFVPSCGLYSTTFRSLVSCDCA